MTYLSNNALQLLYEDLQNRLSIKYILTYKLKNPVLENFFGAIRTKGILQDHHDSLQFKCRLQ